jgi:Protein of unknown function (DUF3467)
MAIPEQSRLIIQGGTPSVIRPGLNEPGGGPSMYVNGIAIYFSPWDFSLMFLRGLPSESAVERTPKGDLEFHVNYRIAQSVVMTPQHAKAMLTALAKNIEQYEAEHGPIPAVESSSSAQAAGSTTPTADADQSS